jgi:hypothetical protein
MTRQGATMSSCRVDQERSIPKCTTSDGGGTVSHFTGYGVNRDLGLDRVCCIKILVDRAYNCEC